MAIKAVEMVRKIRDQHYEQTKNLSIEEQIKFIRNKSKELQKKLKKTRHLITVGEEIISRNTP